jgi:hypothetical protein
MISSRAGNSISKEQYGVIYNNKSQVAKVIDYNLLNYSGKFERPPLNVLMTLAQVTSIGNVTEYNYYNVSFYVIHTKPENTPSEIYELEQLVQSDTSQYKTVLGDLNMDCDYYSGINFGNMKNLIATGTDTTTSATTCAYDRIIISLPLDSRLGSYGVDYSTNQQMSDHRPVFFQLS